MNANNNNQATFPTDNFQLASYLLSNACLLVSVDKTNPKRVAFIFENSPERERLTQEFLSYQGTVEPHKFFSAQRDLKQLIYST